MSAPEPRPRLPTVTCVVTAYNASRYIEETVESVLGHDYPTELLDLVIVEDGSTDGTRELLRSRYGDDPRVLLVEQRNGGLPAATTAGLRVARGELCALLDADDLWLPGRLRRQVELLARHPEVALVYGDMDLIDAEGRTIGDSLFARNANPAPPTGRVLAQLLRGPNFITASSIVFRASALTRLLPLPTMHPAQDWTIAALITQTAAVARVNGKVGHYRLHESNLGGNATGSKFFEKLGARARQQRWLLEHVALSCLSFQEIVEAVSSMLLNAQQSALETSQLPDEVLPVTDDGRERGRALLTDAHALYPSDLAAAACLAARAAAADPWNGAAVAGLTVITARAEQEQSPPVPRIPTRGAAILGFADELADQPDLLLQYAAAVGGHADLTLLIALDAGAEDADRIVERIVAHASAIGLNGDGSADVVVHPYQDLAELAQAPLRGVLSARELPTALSALPAASSCDQWSLGAMLAA